MTLRQTVEQMAALAVLKRAGRPIDSTSFSELLWGKKNRFAVGFLRKLMERGWVKYHGHPSDKYSLTEAGLALFEEDSK